MFFKNTYENNMWKMFLYILTSRRLFNSILAIYFLTFENTTANQIGIAIGLGYLFSFILEIPSGYISDKFGHKNILILSKILLLLSTSSFLFIQNFYGYILGSIFLGMAEAFNSGTLSAFFYETLERLNKQEEYSKLFGRIKGNISLISIGIIMLIPFTIKIDITIPLFIGFFLDIFGFFIATSFKNTKNIKRVFKDNFLKNIKSFEFLRLLPFSIFFGAITGFLISENVTRYVYLEMLGFPVIFFGFFVGFSRFVIFVVSRYSYLIEKHFTMKQHLVFEMIFFSLLFIMVGYFSDPYVVAFIIASGVGYLWGRHPVIDSYKLKYYIKDKRYKATILSISGQISYFFSTIMPFVLSFMITIYSFKTTYYFLGINLFSILFICYFFIKKK